MMADEGNNGAIELGRVTTEGNDLPVAAFVNHDVGNDDSMDQDDRFKLYKRVGYCSGSLTFFMFIFVLMSWSKLEFYEQGFKKSKFSGVVYRDKVYGPGRRFIGPDNEFLVYPKSMVDDYLRGLEAWTRATVNAGSTGDDGDGDAGTSVVLDVGYQYILKDTELDKLYDKVGVEFRGYIKNVAINSLKNNATRFSSDEYIMERRMVERELKEAVKGAFSQNAHADLINFQLRSITFPKSFRDRKLAGAIQILKNDAESYRKKARLTRAETTKQVLIISNSALKVREEAKANAVFTKAKAKNEAARLEQSARHEGLAMMSKALNITEQKHLLSMDYMFGMIDNNPGSVYVNFNGIDKLI